ncbi:purine and pyrimidine permease [Candidatus Arthromitus sp. SFB-mouse-Japan]|uniref:cytosine permease n=1 Tax=Candidatus Arthromitus sp. SFB-mouse TaxID=49118 RepID=UPI00021B8209|nr:cytosine permease [Candidatus Arthromitus sp. SFB-mouse]EIA21927.1 Cytosine permease [Candidatus Arthromitus sp. SFB-2]EIA23379.1 Cytosine permease [Candidatus Arthromitus sp. SFB-1]EIA27254.1 Cytosine permease [Candidatus Arthromitus sp. SFB-co]EIA30025.1 Cytosine permease [Candidatus Arthromitus sp. SFB-mouse-SU]EGX28311.1 cytosine permease [Candidatus Arthromitus sp. SFB-mouse-NYU]
MNKNKMSDIDYSLSSVDPNDRKGFFSIFVVMLGFTFFSASMLTGATIGVSLSLNDFLKSILIGNLILSIYTGLLSYIGSDTGLSLHLLTKYSFGLKGSYLPSFITSITQIGWFGVGISMFAIPISNRFNINLYVIVLITGILMTSTAYFGMKSLTILSAIAVPAIAILGGLSLFIALQSIGGFGKLYSITPTNPMNLITAITLCIGSFISGGTVTPDFTRFSRTKKIAVSTTVIAFFIGNSLMFLFGAIGAMVTGNSDIADVMFSQGLIIPAIIVLGLNIWTTNDNAIYTAGLGLSNITKVKKSKLVLISGLIGTLGSIWINNNFTAFLTLLNSMLPPIGGVVIADYFFIKKLKYNKIEVTKFKEINPIAIISFIIGFLVSNFISFGIPAINAIISTIIVYIIGMKIFKDKDV